MARGQRKTIEEKIAAKEEIIEALEVRIQKEKEELKELSSLNDLISENGLDIDSVKDLILQSVG